MTGVQTCALPICFPVTIDVDVTQPNSYEINESTMMNSLINEKPSQHEDFKPYMGNAIYTSSDSYKTVGVMQPKNYVRRKTN